MTIEPGNGVAHRLGIKLAADGAATLAACHQPGIGENVEMLHDRRQRRAERLRQRADRQSGLLGESRQQSPPRRIGKRRKGAVEGYGVILNHVVKYKAGHRPVKLPA